MPLRAIEKFRAAERGIERARDRHALIRHQQRAERTTEVLNAMTHELLERAGVLALVLVDRQQQIESAVVARRRREHRPLEIHPVLEAVEHRAQQAREKRAAVAATLV